MDDEESSEVVVLGGGLAGLSAAIYLARALRDVVTIDDGRSLALWEPEVQNYLGFPDGVAGETLLQLGRRQAESHGARFVEDRIETVNRAGDRFFLQGRSRRYVTNRLLLATGLFHLPPDIPGVDECLGHSMFFCKDCDAYRVQGKRIAVIGRNDEAVEYALGMLLYTACVVIATNGKPSTWSARHSAWIQEYELPILTLPVREVEHDCGTVRSLTFADGTRFAVDSIFTTRGDVYHSNFAQALGADLDDEGQIIVDAKCRTSVPGLYAAGCVTPANCQMIIAAGQGATAAQAINRDIFETSLENHALRRFREHQLRTKQTQPEVLS